MQVYGPWLNATIGEPSLVHTHYVSILEIIRIILIWFDVYVIKKTYVCVIKRNGVFSRFCGLRNLSKTTINLNFSKFYQGNLGFWNSTSIFRFKKNMYIFFLRHKSLRKNIPGVTSFWHLFSGWKIIKRLNNLLLIWWVSTIQSLNSIQIKPDLKKN